MWPEEHFEVATGHAFPGCLAVAASFFPFAWHARHFASYIWGRKICGSRFIPRPITFVQIRLPDVAESECPGQQRRGFFLSIAHGINAFAVGSGNSKFIFPVVESEFRMFAQHSAAVRPRKRARHRRSFFARRKFPCDTACRARNPRTLRAKNTSSSARNPDTVNDRKSKAGPARGRETQNGLRRVKTGMRP